MWCTRWYLPLLLLPLPTAPPYFLILFLLSLTMHAKPCFYCIVLLTTLFVSSCYWQPFPMNNPLSKPWSENITTFTDALHASLPHTDRPLPSVMHVVDRCWCDFSAGGFFEPFNVSRWEEISVERFKADLVRRQEAEDTVGQDLADNATVSGLSAGHPDKPTEDPSKAAPIQPPSPPAVEGIWTRLQKFSRWKFESLSSDHTSLSNSKPSHDPPSKRLPDVQQTPTVTQEKLPLIRREYDLNPYGLDMVIDFGWTR